MLDSIKHRLSDAENDTRSFSDMYNDYVMQIQDMDIDNEILPLIKKESTECIQLQMKLMRKRRRDVRRLKS